MSLLAENIAYTKYEFICTCRISYLVYILKYQIEKFNRSQSIYVKTVIGSIILRKLKLQTVVAGIMFVSQQYNGQKGIYLLDIQRHTYISVFYKFLLFLQIFNTIVKQNLHPIDPIFLSTITMVQNVYLLYELFPFISFRCHVLWFCPSSAMTLFHVVLRLPPRLFFIILASHVHICLVFSILYCT